MATNNLDIKATSQYIQLLTFTWGTGAYIARYAAADKPYTDSIPNTYAEHSLGEKFGVNLLHAAQLLTDTKSVAKTVGVCFHVGSQCENCRRV